MGFLAIDRSLGPPGESCPGLGELLKLPEPRLSVSGEQWHGTGSAGFRGSPG